MNLKGMNFIYLCQYIFKCEEKKLETSLKKRILNLFFQK